MPTFSWQGASRALATRCRAEHWRSAPEYVTWVQMEPQTTRRLCGKENVRMSQDAHMLHTIRNTEVPEGRQTRPKLWRQQRTGGCSSCQQRCCAAAGTELHMKSSDSSSASTGQTGGAPSPRRGNMTSHTGAPAQELKQSETAGNAPTAARMVVQCSQKSKRTVLSPAPRSVRGVAHSFSIYPSGCAKSRATSARHCSGRRAQKRQPGALCSCSRGRRRCRCCCRAVRRLGRWRVGSCSSAADHVERSRLL